MSGAGKILTLPDRCQFLILILDQGNMQVKLAQYESTLEMDVEALVGRRFGNGQLKTFSFQQKKQLRISDQSTWNRAQPPGAVPLTSPQEALTLLESFFNIKSYSI